MSKKAIALLTVTLLLACAAVVAGQETTTTTVTQTPTTVTKTVQNPDGTFTVIEYPVGKEVQVVLTPVGITAEGVATILRDDAGTRIKLNLNKLPAEVSTINLYAVDNNGVVTLLGPATVTSGSANFNTTTTLSKFMIIASPEAKLAAYSPETKVLFRSAVPAGLAVIPMTTAPVGEKVAATTAVTPAAETPVAVTPATETPVAATPVDATVYAVPMLNIPAFKTGDDTKMKVNFTGPLAGARANVFIKPRKDGPTEVKVRFHEMKDAPSGKIYHVWAVSPDNQFTKLGQVVNVPGRNEAEVKTEVALPDFGLLITLEDATAALMGPHGDRIGFVEIIK